MAAVVRCVRPARVLGVPSAVCAALQPSGRAAASRQPPGGGSVRPCWPRPCARVAPSRWSARVNETERCVRCVLWGLTAFRLVPTSSAALTFAHPDVELRRRGRRRGAQHAAGGARRRGGAVGGPARGACWRLDRRHRLCAVPPAARQRGRHQHTGKGHTRCVLRLGRAPVWRPAFKRGESLSQLPHARHPVLARSPPCCTRRRRPTAGQPRRGAASPPAWLKRLSAAPGADPVPGG